MKPYFFTYGRGMNDFAKNELVSLMKNYELCIVCEEIEGKLIFNTNAPLLHLLGLKTVERLFRSILFKKFEATEFIDGSIVLNLIETLFNFSLFESINFTDGLEEDIESEKSLETKKPCKSLKFRIDCKFTGKWKKLDEFKLKLIEVLIGKIKKSNPHLDVDLKNADFTLTCHLTDLCLIIGLPISKQPLSLRPYIKNVGLRSTICAAMIQLANLESSDCKGYFLALDPFCGRSTIATEMLNSVNNVFFVCSDFNFDQIEKSEENLKGLESKHSLVRANLCEQSIFPYNDGLFDLIITDLPFGKNHTVGFFSGKHIDSRTLFIFYKKTLSEFIRLLCQKRGTMVLLVNSNEIAVFTEALNDLKHSTIRMTLTHAVSLGETNATIVKIINY